MLTSELREARIAQGLTLAALADMTGIAQPNLSRIENGLVDARISTVLRIAEALGLEVKFERSAVTTLARVRERMSEGAKRLAQRGITDRNAERRLEWKQQRGIATAAEEEALR